MLLVGRQEVHPACKKYGGMVDTPSVSPDGVAPSQMVSMSTSVTLPLHHKVQKFSFGIGSPRWSQKKDRKSVVVCWWVNRLQKSIPFWILLEQEMMQWQWHQMDHMQITCTLLQTTTPAIHHSAFTGRMPFLPPNQQHQNTDSWSLTSLFSTNTAISETSQSTEGD